MVMMKIVLRLLMIVKVVRNIFMFSGIWLFSRESIFIEKVILVVMGIFYFFMFGLVFWSRKNKLIGMIMFLMVVSSGSVVLCGVDNLLLMIFFFIFSFMVKKKMAINLLFIYSSNGLEKLFFLIEIFIGVFYKLK